MPEDVGPVPLTDLVFKSLSSGVDGKRVIIYAKWTRTSRKGKKDRHYELFFPAQLEKVDKVGLVVKYEDNKKQLTPFADIYASSSSDCNPKYGTLHCTQ